VAELRRELWDTRRRLAVAEVALQLQHALSNPLAALLAEAQLLELEQLLPEHRTAVHRIIELCRRMSATLRTLDVAQRAPQPAPQRGG
jgi:signal transduction histidine kinase